MVSMPLKEYGNTQLEFIAIMPNDLDNYIKENKIRDDLKKLQEPTDKQELAIMIPRFKFEYDLHLKQDMQKLGINTVFDKDNADLSGISDTGKLFVNDAIHRANIEFSEEGIKAAAVTVILMTDATAIRDQMQTISLYFNKPFMFLIRDAKNGEEWFTGTVYEPILWDDVKSDYDPQ
jgi:serpin B